MNKEGKTIMKLYRARKDRYIGGVCGGLAHYFSFDSNLVRLLFVLSLLIGGIGFIMYIAALILVPEVEGEEEAATSKIVDGNMFLGVLLMAAGLILLLREMDFFHIFDLFDLPVSTIWALTLIAIGAFILYNHWRQDGDSEAKAETTDSTKSAFMDIQRSRHNRKIAGVCGGIADYFEIDATLVRLGWVLLTLMSFGLGIILYLLALLVFPEESSVQTSS